MELLITIIVLALIFDYINGFHDAANAIATIVSTKVLTPLQAVIWAAFFNFLAFFIAKYLIGDFGIANTVSKTVYEQYITLPVIFCGPGGEEFLLLHPIHLSAGLREPPLLLMDLVPFKVRLS